MMLWPSASRFLLERLGFQPGALTGSQPTGKSCSLGGASMLCGAGIGRAVFTYTLIGGMITSPNCRALSLPNSD
jgi:hypothetical protein